MKYDKQICPICGRPLVKHGKTIQGQQKFYCKGDQVEFVADGTNLVADSGEVFQGAFAANQGQTRQQAREQVQAEETKQLYAEVSRVLTEFEVSHGEIAEDVRDLYAALVKVQNWFAENDLDN